ncbi:MAG: hypothetical protein KA020_06990 [Planctomycetes bacterium]|jgi:hypothetical protein|nr:hypothetical protein [Planctomycetota bacterium]MCC7064002.1 hypothetical protein [Planctomycetota bacterium]
MNERAPRIALVTGWLLLAFSLPLGLTLEALHAWKVPVYLGSALRRELWTLAHAHGNLLGILCLVFAALGARVGGTDAQRARLARWLAIGAVLMPLGFLLGGVMNREGDPSYGIVLVPAGAVILMIALFGTARLALGRSGEVDPA